MVKDAAEIDALRRAARAVDAVAAEMRARPFAGRTEIDVHRELVDRILEHGHERANFAIVGAGRQRREPAPRAVGRVIDDGDVVVCDFGGTMAGYCSDITRMFVVGEPDARGARRLRRARRRAGSGRARRDRRHDRARRSTPRRAA